jgi:exodeoxyribonuclease-3
MAFRKKADVILTYKPDILLILECEHPDKLIFPVDSPKPTQTLWFGKNKIKDLQYFLPAILIKVIMPKMYLTKSDL